MKVLVIGNGGREHALCWKLKNDSRNPEIFCAPGNAGTAELGTNLDLVATDVEGITEWAKAHQPDLTVIGPEAPLCVGMADALEAEGFRVFGPKRAAAELEGSKEFAKEIMKAGGVPTSDYAVFTEAEPACRYVREKGAPIVIKADGLAAGKGVTVAETVEQAEAAINDALGGAFGEAGSRVVIEDFLVGEEASILALIDGEHVVMLASSQDHKRAYDGDTGPNTGGMGAYSPAPIVTDAVLEKVRTEIYDRTLAELKKRGITYKGVLYAGLMIDNGQPSVVEFNCRFGDPETQAVLIRWDDDIIPAIEACIDGTLSEELINWKADHSVCVVMSAGGYPGSYEKGHEIRGLDDTADDAIVFHAGTALKDGKVVTAGGRVLGVTALGADLRTAVDNATAAVEKISWKDAFYRKDIAHRAL
ncbi:phosphoribosylamine--glycine ligase [Tichowtungia aerotolerans]|uniref:Phosphoribosylamine--glycine ligase n=1 Tax=Tichowtungia aerotolerans TaxID=2697043 RepID=A0A6P1M4D2_9BACT|nr:phosphoribosylamine--glycine ligase [Tichowtungia aerotolerans]QHI68902.1 phosphoribosylamine--glycine ligase [Tichowtungia aerotolerans]